MEHAKDFNTVHDYNQYGGQPTWHPLVSMVDLSKAPPNRIKRLNLNIYVIILKDTMCGDLRYGKEHYDYQAGTMLFFAPGQVVHVEDDGELHQPKGLVLVFHPDLLRGTPLGQHLNEYTFFTYQLNEGLHLSEQEQKIVRDCFAQIALELQHPVDKHSKRLIASTLELLLNYCVRFYDRQFITRDIAHRGVVERFEHLLNDYLFSGKSRTEGLPSVKYFAEQVNLSANYFGDIIKKETGKPPHEYIQLKVLDVAKEMLFDDSKSVSQVAFELGFKYSQHFSRLFKQKVGVSPQEYRALN